MISFLVLILSITILIWQISLDKRSTALAPHVLFQVYFIIQLPLNLFLGVNYYLPRFQVLSPLTSGYDIARLGGLFLVAQLVFVATVQMTGNKKPARLFNEVTWPRIRVNLLCAGIFIVGYVAFFGLIYMNGGFAAFAETRELWRTAGVGGQGWVLFPATTMLAIAMCAVMINNSQSFMGKSGLLRITVLYSITAVPASQLGFRGLIFFPALQAAFFYHKFVRPISLTHIISGSLLMMLTFTLYGVQREIPYSADQGSYFDYIYYIYFTRPDITYTIALRSMGADIVQIVIDHMNSFGGYIMMFPAVIEAATIAIPSSIWAGKPLPLSVQFSRNIFGIDGGVSPTVVGEGYWHAGIIGVIIIMAMAGLLHAYFRFLQSRASTNPFSSLLMLSLYPSLIMMAESFQGYFNGIVLIVIGNWLFKQAVGSGYKLTNRANPPIMREMT